MTGLKGRLGVVVGVLGAIAAPAVAQTRATTADLSGTVWDQSRAVLPGATVTFTNVETGLVRTAITEADGRFVVPAVQVGTYTLVAELSGFDPYRLEGVLVSLGTSIAFDITLRVSGTEESVTVTAESPLVEVQKTAVSTVVSQRQIESLPINGRNFISFSIITPGVSTDQTPQQGASATSGLTFAGQRARSNNITVDGVDNNDATVGSVRATFSQEAVREFQVLTNSYSAEFGKATGGVVNIVTKSGTNNVDGSAFFYYRDKSLNARGHFEDFDPAGNRIDAAKAPFSQKQFGGTIGGPIRRDKTFFFASVERLDVSTSNFVNIDDRTIIRHPVSPALSLCPAGQTCTAAQILRNAGFPVETGNVPYAVESTQFLAKIDQQLKPTQNLSFRVNVADDLNENLEPFGGLVARSRAAALDSRDWMVAASHTAVISTKIVNELRFQLASRDQVVYSLDPTCNGICDMETEGGPTLEVTGFASVGRQRFTPQPRENIRYQVLDTFSYYAGDHQLKTGLDFSFIDHKSQSLPLHFGGRYIFRDLALTLVPGLPPFPVSPIQAVALGVPAAYVQGYGDSSGPYPYKDLSFFVQDDWRVSSRLTLKAGLRYQNQYWPDFTYDVPGYDGTYAFPRDSNNFAPRLAASFDPTGSGKTSVHGAYGLFFDNHITGVAGITDLIDGADKVRTFVAALNANPALSDQRAILAWSSPGRRLPEAVLGTYPSLVISIDPGLQTPYAHHASVGVDRELPGELALSANFVYVRGNNQLGTIDYNPVIPSLITTGRLRPVDTPGRPLSSASVLQYTSFGETWYRGFTASLSKRFSRSYQLMASYTLSKAEDNSTDYQSAFVPQDNGAGRDPADPNGLPVGFDPNDEKGPSLQDQRHRLVVSGLYVFPWDIHASFILTAASGRPYNVRAGADTNNDGNGGADAPDRPWTTPGDLSTRIGRNVGEMPAQSTFDLRLTKRFRLGERAAFDAIFEVFNLFDRTNYIGVNEVFGTGAYPSNPLSTFGQYTQAGPPRQMQLAARLSF